MEVGKGGDKRLVRLPFRVDAFRQTPPKRRHPFPELCDSLFPFRVLLRTVGKEGFERPYQLRGIGQVGIKRLPIVLPKDSAARFLEKDVVTRIASLKLAYHFGRQVIILIFRLPIAVCQPEPVHQRAINNNPPASIAGHRMFGDERPIKPSRTALEQRLERRLHSSLMRYTELIKPI